MAPLSCPSMSSFRPTSQLAHLARTGTSLTQVRQKQIVRMPTATSRSLLQSRDMSASFTSKLRVIRGRPRGSLAFPAPRSHGIFENWTRNEPSWPQIEPWLHHYRAQRTGLNLLEVVNCEIFSDDKALGINGRSWL